MPQFSMRDLHQKKQKPVNRNKAKRQRAPLNYRRFFKRLVRLVSWVTVISLVGVIGYELHGFVARTAFLKLERIEINSLTRLTRDEILTQAGIKPGDGMLSLRLSTIGEQLGKNPWVAKVKLRRYMPNTLIIDIVEREPVAIANMGYLYYLDNEGEIFKPLTVGDRLDFPVITGITEEDLARDPAGAKAALKDALALMDLLRTGSALKLDDVSEIHFDKGFGFTLFAMERGIPVRLGSSDLPGKMQRLARIYRELQEQMASLEYIDLDYSDKIIVKKS